MAGLALAITAAMAALLFSRIAWTRAALPWPLFCLGALAVAVRRLREAAPEREREIAAATFAAFALALLGKMLLNARTSHYGFVLAMPALALLVVVLYDGIPRWIERQGGTAAVARAGLAPLLVAFALAHLSVTARHLAAKRIPVGDGPDAFRADPRGLAVNATLTWLAGHTAPGSRPPTVLVVPEGVLINYLARSENPTPYVNFMPPEILLFGEPRIVETLASHPPDVVVVTHKPTHEYGLPWFGRDYAAELAGWLERNYHPVELFGDSPLHPGSRFGIAILARNGGGR